MRFSGFRTLRVLFLFVLSSLISFPAVASPVEIEVFQGKAVRTVDASGVVTEQVVPAETIVPGETVVYRYIVHNRGGQNADSVVVKTSVDPNMTYVGGSATDNGVEFSADRGTHFAKEDELKVLDVDGTWREARPEDVTDIRWKIQNPVEPDRPLSVEFRALLK